MSVALAQPFGSAHPNLAWLLPTLLGVVVVAIMIGVVASLIAGLPDPTVEPGASVSMFFAVT